MTVVLAMVPASTSAQESAPPDVIGGYQTELLAPGVWQVVDDGTDNPLDAAMHEIRVSPDGSVWILGDRGAFELGIGSEAVPSEPSDRLFAVDSDGNAWLRYDRDNRQGFGTWDGVAWTDRSGPRRRFAKRPDPARAPGVIRDLAVAPDGAVWVVAGEQDGPRWQRFTIERLDEDGWTTWAIRDGLPKLKCGKNCGDNSRVIVTDDGTVWVSVDQGGLLRYVDGRWSRVRPLAGKADRPIRTLIGNRDGILWAEVSARRGKPLLARFDGQDWQTFDSTDANGRRPFAEVDEGPLTRVVAPDGTLWGVGTRPDGPLLLRALDGEQLRDITDLGLCRDSATQRWRHVEGGGYVRETRCGGITSLATGSDGTLWATAILPPGPEEGNQRGALLVVDPEAALDGGVVGDEPGPLAELESNERLWERARPASYTYVVERLCFCPPEWRGPVRVSVSGTDVTGRAFVDSGRSVGDTQAEAFPAVEGLFDLIRGAIEDEAHALQVEYDPILGVPVSFWIDYDELVADEELGMMVTEAVTPS